MTPGSRLGPYEILSALGAGGMGEVYRARDTKLNRDVALKVLLPALANDPERLARFRREAQVLAALNHPHIAQIYGVEDRDGTTALAMEFVAGVSLAERLARGPLPVEDALAIARQIAEALEAAHEKGIIHRDLKPANIMLTPDEQVKVLDFGLAKALEAGAGEAGRPGGAGGDASQSPTITSPALMTAAGMILGTAAYMSPEQAKGRPADKRSDVWAFGCVLYEMLAHARPFNGEDVADTLASVLRSEPDWTKLPPSVAPGIRRLVRRCLTKDLLHRVPDIAVARFELDDSTAQESAGIGSSAPRAGHVAWWRAAVVGLGVGVVAAAGGWALHRPAAPAVVRLNIPAPGGVPLGTTSYSSDVAISSDGRWLAFITGNVGAGDLWLRSLDQLAARKVPGMTAPSAPFFSPDGNWLGFYESGTSELKKVAVGGGQIVPILHLNGLERGFSWSDDGSILFGLSSDRGLWRVSSEGGEAESLAAPAADRGEFGFEFPTALPGGHAALFAIRPAADPSDTSKSRIAALDIKTRKWKVVVEGGSDPRYVRTGHLLFNSGGRLMAVPFDLEALQTRGASVQLIDRLTQKAGTGASSYAVSATGTLVYLSGDAPGGGNRSLVWVDREGHEEPLGAPQRAYAYPRVSPDGRRVALDIRDEQSDIWMWDVGRKSLQRLTLDPGPNRGVAWSPDGKRVAFGALVDGVEQIYSQAADGSGARMLLTKGSGDHFPEAFSPDGRQLIFSVPGSPPYDIDVVPVDGSARSEPLLHSPASERGAMVSPDARWLVYQSNESGIDEIYVRPFPNVNAGRWQISTGGGTRPMWAHSGTEIFYYQAPGKILAVPVSRATTFEAGTPKVIISGNYFPRQDGRNYDETPDGRHFVMVKNVADPASAPTEFVVVLNWFEELQAKVAVK